ncbi:hypothetical protein D3C81_1683710 [compost metagenome]
MRHSVRYCIGGCPTNAVNRSANTERDMPTSSASASAVQPSVGRACSSASARPICASRKPASHPRRSAGRLATYWPTASTNSSSDSLAMTVVEPTRPAAISLTAKRNELSIQVPDAVARRSSFNKEGSDESNGLKGVCEPRNPHNNCVASPPPPYLIREMPPTSGGWMTSLAGMGAMLRSLPKECASLRGSRTSSPAPTSMAAPPSI